MAFFEWDESLVTHITEIDEHHQQLVALLNKLYEQVFECSDIDEERALTRSVLKELADYTAYHFTAEEALLEQHQYPELTEHKQAHALFMQKVDELMREYEQGGLALSFPTFTFLKDWISTHIRVTDAHYAAYLQEQR